MAAGQRKILVFNARAYIDALAKQLKKANHAIRQDLMREMMSEIQTIDFKDNDVKMADGTVTSDAKRKSALLQSFATQQAEWITRTSLRSMVYAMKSNFKDSHVGLYYEFGTGVENTTSNYESLGDWNPFRIHATGQPIVSRSRHVGMTAGLLRGKSAWHDIGGNMRVTGSKRGGQDDGGFRKYIGEDVEAYHWFSDTINTKYMKGQVKEHITTAFQSVRIINYIEINEGQKKFILGKH